MTTFVRICRLSSRVTLLLISLALAVALMQWLTGYPLRWSWELAPNAAERQEGRGLEFRLPKWLSHDPEAPGWFAGVVCESDIPLARRTASRRDVFEKGEGRYWIKGERAALSASDATIPLTNGRRYELRASVAVKGQHVIGLLLLGAAVLLMSARLHGASSSWRDGAAREWTWLGCATGLRALVVWRRRLTSTSLVLLTWAMVGCLVIGRLYAMAGEEIAASQWDPEMYALVALDPGTFGSHPPGVSWLMRAWAELGIPARLGFEMLYLAAGAVLGAALARLTGNRVVGLLIFATFVLFPASRFFKLTSVEPVVLCSLTIAGGFILSAVASKRNGLCNPSLLGAAGSLALWEVSRVETPLVMVTAVLAACVHAQGRFWRHGSNRLRSGILAGGVLLSVTAASWCFICAWNWMHHGVWAKCSIDLPGARRLLAALYSIETPDASRFAPVTRATLRTAATVSPTIERRLSGLLNPQSPAIAFGEAVCGRKGEPGPWLNWLLMEVFSQPPPEGDSGDTALAGRWPVAKMNAEMQRAATEIRSAIDQGRIAGRPGIYPLDPHLREWIPHLPGAIQTAWLELSDIPKYAELSDAANYSTVPANDSLSSLTQAATDAAALRRTSLTGNKWIDLELDLRKAWQGVVMASLEIDTRSIAAARCEIKDGGGGDQYGHTRLQCGSFPDGEEDRLSLRFWSVAGVAATIPWREIRSGRVILPLRSDNGQTMEVIVTGLARMPRSFIRENRKPLLEALPALYKRSLPLLMVAALITGFLAANQARAADVRTLWLACLWLAAILGGRLCFYALLFAMMGWGMARYLGPLAPLLYASFVAIACALGVTVRLALRQSGAKAPSPG